LLASRSHRPLIGAQGGVRPPPEESRQGAARGRDALRSEHLWAGL